MEKVLEVCNNIKDRLSNPFVFSFICSWLVYNWRIPVALFWFDEKQISANGCSSIFEFIEDDWKRNGSIGWPLVFAFVYSFGIPYVKNFFRIVSARAQKWGENGEIKALDGGKIGVEKYLKLREEYKEAIKKLEDVDKEEKEYLTEKGKLLNEFNGVREELNQKIKENGDLRDSLARTFDSSILNGNWLYNSSIKLNLKIKINNSRYSLLDNNGFPTIVYEMKHFFIKSNYVFFILIEEVPTFKDKPMSIIYNLRRDNDDRLVGIQDGEEISLIRVSEVNFKKSD